MAPEKAITKRCPVPAGQGHLIGGQQELQTDPLPPGQERPPRQPHTAGRGDTAALGVPLTSRLCSHKKAPHPASPQEPPLPGTHFPQRSSPLESLPRSFTPRQRRAVARVHLLIPRHRGRGAGFFRWPSAPTARARAAGSARESRSPTSGKRSAALREQPLRRQSRPGRSRTEGHEPPFHGT